MKPLLRSRTPLSLRLAGLLLSAVCSTAVQAQECPLAQPKGLCAEVQLRVKDKASDSNYVFAYQRSIYESACADLEKDSDKEIARKVRLWWAKNNGAYRCNSPQIPTANASLLKVAVTAQVREFLEDAAVRWRVDLNDVGEADGRTVLDYVQDRLDRYQGQPATQSVLQSYYDMLRKAGAKHARELKTP